MEVLKILVIGQFFLNFAHYSGAEEFECFQCNSHLDKECDNKPSERYLKKCEHNVTKAQCFGDTTGRAIDKECQKVRERCQSTPEGCDNLTEEINIRSNLCLKSVSYVYGTVTVIQGDTRTDRYQVSPRVTRGCGYIKDLELGEGCFSRRNGGSSQVSCSCRGSGCNEANSLQKPLQRFQLLLLLILVYSVGQR